MTSSTRWISAINDACADADAARSNHLITTLHYELSKALTRHFGRDAGPNFHTWAVWGSRKAGETIRQEDLDSAIRNATATAGAVGCGIGAATGVLVGRRLRWRADVFTAALGAAIGTVAGASSGKSIAVWSRARAAELVLQGNRTVLKDIGQQSARFLELIENGASLSDRAAFFAGLRPGPTEQLGQDRLATAFRLYLKALDSSNFATRQAAMVDANCEIVYHEHIRLTPYIRAAMPFIVRRCATQRLMTYQIGNRVLLVSEDVPGVPAPTAATNWVSIHERMRYVFALFRKFHNDPELFSAPFPDEKGNVAQAGN